MLTNHIVEKLIALLLLTNHIVVKLIVSLYPGLQYVLYSEIQYDCTRYAISLLLRRTPAYNMYSYNEIQYDCTRYAYKAYCGKKYEICKCFSWYGVRRLYGDTTIQ